MSKIFLVILCSGDIAVALHFNSGLFMFLGVVYGIFRCVSEGNCILPFCLDGLLHWRSFIAFFFALNHSFLHTWHRFEDKTCF
jgi:hypothetical protein